MCVLSLTIRLRNLCLDEVQSFSFSLSGRSAGTGGDGCAENILACPLAARDWPGDFVAGGWGTGGDRVVGGVGAGTVGAGGRPCRGGCGTGGDATAVRVVIRIGVWSIGGHSPVGRKYGTETDFRLLRAIDTISEGVFRVLG